MKSLESKISEADLYLHLVSDAIIDAQRVQKTLIEEVKEINSELKKYKEFFEFAGLQSIYKKWETNDQLPLEEYEPLDFEEMYEEENSVSIFPAE